MGHPIFASVVSVFLLGIGATEALGSFRLKSIVRNYGRSEFVGGSSHPCYRKCIVGDSRVCNYTFTLTQYTSMSFACRDCPVKRADYFREGCVTAGGHVRPITVANHMLPGPSIQVCEDDRIVVKVVNAFTSETATIHWHGIHQVATPYMDGTPFVTQCPIPPHNSFDYDFVASPTGTHIWHSHMGFEETDGLYGSLIVRKPEDPYARYYDYDLAEHVMIIWHWFDSSTAFRLSTALHKFSSVSGYGLLINGLAAKAEISVNETIYKTPRKVFEVVSGKKYRFRTIFNSALYCPIQISIDDHTLLVIASDSGTFEPVEVDSFVINGGERYDFVLNANKSSGNYWIRYRGLGDCRTRNVRVSEAAVLRYDNSPDEEPAGTTNYDDAKRSGKLLNPVQVSGNSFPNNTLVMLTELNGTTPNQPDVSGTPNHTFYFKFSFNIYDSYYAPGPYPQINDMSFDYPAFPLLTESDALTSDMYCTETNDTAKECIDGFCSCPLIYRVAKDSLVEIVFVDNSTNRDQDHPMHLHGYDFRVVAMVPLGVNSTVEAVKAANEAGKIAKKFDEAPVKDSVGVPAKGFTIVRLVAKNPGYWFFHCHIANHAEMGMGFVLKVGENDEIARPPPGFPRCGGRGFENCPIERAANHASGIFISGKAGNPSADLAHVYMWACNIYIFYHYFH